MSIRPAPASITFGAATIGNGAGGTGSILAPCNAGNDGDGDACFGGFESLLFYPRVFIGEYSPSPAVGVAALLLAASVLRRLRGTDEASRVLALALLFSTITTVAHPYKQSRFFILTATLLWFAGSREAVGLVDRAISRVGKTTRRWAAAAVAAAALLTAAVTAIDDDRLPAPRPSPSHGGRLHHRGAGRHNRPSSRGSDLGPSRHVEPPQPLVGGMELPPT